MLAYLAEAIKIFFCQKTEENGANNKIRRKKLKKEESSTFIGIYCMYSMYS
jgi:hypothetical protein